MSSDLSTRIRGVGPIYVATERRCSVRAHFSRAWITEMAPPYRKGKGVRVRVGRYAVQVGIAHPADVDDGYTDEHEEDEFLIEHIGWRPVGAWAPEWEADATPDH